MFSVSFRSHWFFRCNGFHRQIRRAQVFGHAGLEEACEFRRGGRGFCGHEPSAEHFAFATFFEFFARAARAGVISSDFFHKGATLTRKLVKSPASS